MLSKVKAIIAATVVAMVGGGGVYLTTDVDWATAFGPGLGGVVASAIAYGVPMGVAEVKEYLDRWAV